MEEVIEGRIEIECTPDTVPPGGQVTCTEENGKSVFWDFSLSTEDCDVTLTAIDNVRCTIDPGHANDSITVTASNELLFYEPATTGFYINESAIPSIGLKCMSTSVVE